MQNFQNPITLFHKILACFWLFGMVFLSFGAVTAQTATDRQNHSEVGLMFKPLTAASKWLIRKQVKAFFGDIEAQAVITTNDIVGNILMQVQYAWEKAWQTAILQAALKLISAIFKIISDFVNKLMDMIGNIGNLNAVLAPFASSIVGVARSAYSKVVACADYWARRELQEVLPAIDTGGKGRECPWLNEEPESAEKTKIGFTNADTTEKIEKLTNRVVATLGGSSTIPKPTAKDLIDSAAEAKTAFSFSKTVKFDDCDSGDPFFNRLSGVACLTKYEETVNRQFVKDQEIGKITDNITNTQDIIQAGIAGEPILSNNSTDNLAVVPKLELEKLEKGSGKNKTKVAKLPDWWNPKSLKDSQKDLSIIALPKVNWLDKQLDVIALQTTQKPQPGGSAEKSFTESLTDQFSKMLNDLITNVLESVVFKIVDFISDNLLKAINFFLGPDSILGGLGLDSVAGDLVNTMRDGIKDSVSSIGKSISDPLASSAKSDSDAVAVFRCDGKFYWKDSSGYELAKLAGCQYTEQDFDVEWCKEYTSKDDYNTTIAVAKAFANITNTNRVTEILQKTCTERGLKFELKT